MKSSDRMILIVLLGLLAVGGLWFGVVSPKRSELAKLDETIATAEVSVSQQEQLVAVAEQAQESYPTDYQRLIVLGKAVPSGDDAASLIEQIDTLAARAGVEFSGLQLSEGAGGGEVAAPAPAPAAVPQAGDEAVTPASSPATETAASTLPLGATVGAAGLPVMPYDLTFSGSFFDIADFMDGLDDMVQVRGRGLAVNGRLLTIDGFSLSPDQTDGFPKLSAALHVTSFVTPADQGLTGGATPTTPALAPAPVSTSAAPPVAPAGTVMP